MKRLKQIVSKVGSGVTPRGGADVYVEAGVVFLRSQNIHFEGLRLDDVVHIDTDTDTAMERTRVRSGDVLLNITGASIGRCALVPPDFPNANVNQHVCIIRSKSILNPAFLNYSMRSLLGQIQIDFSQTGANREGLNFGLLGNFAIIFPSLPEQRAIVAFLDQGTGRIDALIEKVRDSIAKLREYRTALISAAVTGKINVSDECRIMNDEEGIKRGCHVGND